MRLLILGGTTEASALARRIAARADIDAIVSLAGRTANPARPPIPFRVGGFGGVEGLKAYLIAERIGAVVDATHPFAAQMSRNAANACGPLNIPLAVLTRPGWEQQAGDRWTRVPDMAAAARALGDRPRRVFLTVGGLKLGEFVAAPQHFYLVRTIEPARAIDLPPFHRAILARGPFSLEDESATMRGEKIDVLVTKNSGGAATGAKLAAARALGIDAILVERPMREDVRAFESIDAAMAWIGDHLATP